MRLIDADALLKVLECDPDYCGRCKHDHDCSKYLNYTRNDICLTIQEAPTVGGWISVKDRLPEKSCTVLAYHDFGSMQVLDYSAKHRLFNCHDWSSEEETEDIAISSITHWQPLPEPPEEGKVE